MGVGDLLGKAIIELSTDSSKLDLKTPQEKANQLGKQFAITGAAIAAIGVPFALASKSAIDTADNFAKMSQKTGVSVESLSGLAHAANLSGVGVETLQKSLVLAARGMADTVQGTGEAQKAFAALGISVTDSTGQLKGSEVIMAEVADRFARMEDGATKTALATDIFGRAGAELIPLLNAGSLGLASMSEEADRLGLVLSTEAAQSAERFNDSITRMQGGFQGIFNALVESGLLDKATAFVTWITDTAAAFVKANPELSTAVVVMGLMAAAMGPLLIALGLMIPAITAIGPTVLAVFGAAGVLAGATAGLVSFGDTNSQVAGLAAGAWEGLKGKLEPILASVQTLFRDLVAGITEIWKTWGNVILGVIEGIWIVAKGVFGTALNVIGTVLKTQLGVLTGVVNVFAGLLTGNWSKMWLGLKQIVITAFNGIIQLVGTGAKGITSVLQGLFNLFGKVPGFEKVAGFLKEVETAIDKTTTSMTEATREWAGLGKEADQLSSFELPDLKSAFGDTEQPVKDLTVAFQGNQEEAKKAAAEIQALRDKLNEAGRFVMPMTTEELTKLNAEIREAEKVAIGAAFAWAGAPPALQAITDTAASVNAEILATNELFKEVGPTLNKTAVDADNTRRSFELLGVKSAALKQKELADLKAAFENVQAAIIAAGGSTKDLKEAQDAYATAVKRVGGPVEATGLWEKGLKQVSTVLTDLGNDLAGRFSAAVKTGIGPIDDFTNAIIRLVSEQVMGAMIKGLGKLIDSIPGLQKLGDLLKGIGGGSGSSVPTGGGGGGIPGVGPGGGGGGSSGGGGGDPLGGLAGWISAASNVISNFQQAKMETTLNAIEENTRRSMIHLGEGGSSILDWVQEQTRILWLIRGHLWDNGPLVEIRNLLQGGITVGGVIPTAIAEAGDKTTQAVEQTFLHIDDQTDVLEDLRTITVRNGEQITGELERGARLVRAGIDNVSGDIATLGRALEASRGASRAVRLPDLPVPEIPDELKRLPGSAGALAGGQRPIPPRQFGAPRFQSGIDYLPRDTFAMLHQGEAVLTKEENAARMQPKQPVIFKFIVDGREQARVVADNLNDLVSRQSLRLVASEVRS